MLELINDQIFNKNLTNLDDIFINIFRQMGLKTSIGEFKKNIIEKIKNSEIILIRPNEIKLVKEIHGLNYRDYLNKIKELLDFNLFSRCIDPSKFENIEMTFFEISKKTKIKTSAHIIFSVLNSVDNLNYEIRGNVFTNNLKIIIYKNNQKSIEDNLDELKILSSEMSELKLYDVLSNEFGFDNHKVSLIMKEIRKNVL
ncbi:hypothetical protein [Spiroplasma endosymbiont of Panorpa germanica]|uniref:hypothetical protein n=1 Tax=Spiroplasma endosymbiont of Panorpa germanica TaxID=3066314 RepID=UPI0030CCDD67